MSTTGPPGPPSSDDEGEFGGSGEFVEDYEAEHHPPPFLKGAFDFWGRRVFLFYGGDAIVRLRRRAREIVERPPEPVLYRSTTEFIEDVQPYAGFPPLCPMYGLGCLGSHRDSTPEDSTGEDYVGDDSFGTGNDEPGDPGDYPDDEHKEAS